MRVFIYSLPENLETAQKIKTKLELSGYESKLFDSDAKLFCAVLDDDNVPDFIVYDYFLYNHHVFNIYDFLKSEKLYIPVIFFNEPTPHAESTAFFWKNLLKIIYHDPKIQVEEFEPVIDLISEIIDNEKLEKTTTEENIEIFKEFENNWQKIRKQTEKFAKEENPSAKIQNILKGSALILFKTLYENLGKNVETAILQNEISKKSEPCKKNTIYCLVSRIRKSMESIGANDFEIIKNENGYKMIQRL